MLGFCQCYKSTAVICMPTAAGVIGTTHKLHLSSHQGSCVVTKQAGCIGLAEVSSLTLAASMCTCMRSSANCELARTAPLYISEVSGQAALLASARNENATCCTQQWQHAEHLNYLQKLAAGRRHTSSVLSEHERV